MATTSFLDDFMMTLERMSTRMPTKTFSAMPCWGFGQDDSWLAADPSQSWAALKTAGAKRGLREVG
jgi:hypothetical protein